MTKIRTALLASVMALLLGAPAFAATTLTGPSNQGAAQPAFTDLSGSAVCGQLPALTGDATTSAGACATTVAKVNGVSYGTSPSTNTVPVVTSSNTVTYEAVPNAALANAATTVNGQTCTLGSTCTVTPGVTAVTKTGAYGVLNTDAGTWFNNTGAGGSVVLTLPAAPSTNQTNCGFVTAAQVLEFLAPASTKIAVGTTNSATAGNVQSNNLYSSVCIWALSSTQWVASSMTGTWTVN